MKESIFMIDPATSGLEEVRATIFSEIGIKECADLQKWIVKHPALLGEELLLLGSEFSSFSGSGRRVDVLALDRAGVLVVVELKLEMERTHAELQAIRYASMCATMTMDDAVAPWPGTAKAAGRKPRRQFSNSWVSRSCRNCPTIRASFWRQAPSKILK